MRHGMALKLAEAWVTAFAPYCERIEIAGSVRRGKPEVKDIEIVAVPRIEPVKDMFGETLGKIQPLEEYIQNNRAEYELLKNGPKYKKLALHEGIAIDLFLVTPPAQWGVQFVIRTGPAEFSQWMVTKRASGGALPNDCYVDQGAVWYEERAVVMEREVDYFEFCGLTFIEPAQRLPRWRR